MLDKPSFKTNIGLNQNQREMNILKTFAMFSVLLTAQTANAQFCGTILSNGQPEKELSIDPITTSQLKEMVTAVYRRIVEDGLGWGEFVGTQAYIMNMFRRHMITSSNLTNFFIAKLTIITLLFE